MSDDPNKRGPVIISPHLKKQTTWLDKDGNEILPPERGVSNIVLKKAQSDE